MTPHETLDTLRRLRAFREDPAYQGPERDIVTEAILNTLIARLGRPADPDAVSAARRRAVGRAGNRLIPRKQTGPGPKS